MDNFLPGSASLVDCVDKRLVVLLRDGRKFFGILRSYDQFANLVLQDTIERIILSDSYSENHYGLFVIRGENVMLLGEVDPEKELSNFDSLTKISVEEAQSRVKQLMIEKQALESEKHRLMSAIGHIIEEHLDY